MESIFPFPQPEATSPARILIVDDESELTQVLVEMLSGQGYETTGAGTGAEALACLREQSFDVALVDLMMPDTDGLTLLRKAFEIDPNLVGIIMTGRGTVQTAIEAMRGGAYDYLLKPFKLETVLSVLARSLRVRRLKLDNVFLRDLLSVYGLGQAVSSTLDQSLILRKTAQAALEQCQADEVSIQLYDPEGECLEVAYVEGPGRQHLLGECAPLDGSISGYAARQRETLRLEGEVGDARFAPARPRPEIAQSVSMPMAVGDDLVGVINVNLLERATLTEGQIKGLDLLVSIAASAIENARLYERLRRTNHQLRHAYDATIEGWSRALDLRDHETEGHTQRVTEMVLQLARAYGGFSVEDLEHLRRGALLHDIGKMGVPDEVLLKPGELSPDEEAVMRRHPENAYRLLRPIRYLDQALDVPHYHHERWDGSGYPDGLRGAAIPLAARLFAVVDVYDALTSNRPYRRGWSHAEALEYIRAQSGRHFDPQVVDVFLNMFGEEEKP